MTSVPDHYSQMHNVESCIQDVPTLTLLNAFSQPAAVLDEQGHVLAQNDAFGYRFHAEIEEQKFNTVIFAFFCTQSAQELGLFLAGQNINPEQKLKGLVPNRSAFSDSTSFEVAALSALAETPVYLLQQSPEKIDKYQDQAFKFLIEGPHQGVWSYDTRTETFTVSDTWKRIRGLSEGDEMPWESGDWLDLIHLDDRDKLSAAFSDQTEGRSKTISLQYRHARMGSKDWVWILCRASVIEVDEAGFPLRIVGTDTEITDLKEKEARLEQLGNKLQLAIVASGMGVWEFDDIRRQVHWDDRMLEIYGIKDGLNYRTEDFWGKYLHPADRDEIEAYSDYCLANNEDFNRDYRIIRADGEIRHIRSLARFLPETRKLVGVNVDITDDVHRAAELEQAKTQLEYESQHDALTGLANRRLLDQTVASCIANLTPASVLGAMHIDLDHFKQVNDQFGHGAGDLVLQHVAELLQTITPDNALVARAGGDEFVVFFPETTGQKHLTAIAEEILASSNRPDLLLSNECKVGLSIGIATTRGLNCSVTDLFRRADVALYDAKNAGRSCYRICKTMLDE